MRSKINKFIFILLLIFCVSFSARANQEPVKNAGFVPSNIWYSKTPFFAEEKIRVYTIIFNGSSYDLEGTVEFLDEANDSPKVIGKSDFSISGGGRVRDIWIDWKASEGKHIITARIVKPSISLADGTKQIAVIENVETGKSEVAIDLDTDGDRIGNMTDTDDDNDGVSDNDEAKNGTNPLKSDSNGNGISDKKEIDDFVKKIAENKEKDSEKFTEIIKTVTDTIPEPIKNAVMASANAVDSFRKKTGDKIRITKENKLKEIKSFKEKTIASAPKDGKQKIISDKSSSNASSFALKKPFAYATLASLAALQYFFDWKFVFYGIDFYLFYRLMFLIRNKIFHRK